MSNSLIPSFAYIFILVISSIWLLHKLGWLAYILGWIQKINNKSGVLIPSFVVLIAPFIAAKATEFVLHDLKPQSTTISSSLPLLFTPFIWSEFVLHEAKPQSTNILSSLSPFLSPIIAIFVFIAGRRNANLERKQEDKKEERKQVNLLIFKIATAINYLSHIEALLMSSIQYPNDNSDDNKIGEEVTKYKLEIDSIYDKLSFQIEYFSTNDALSGLIYIDTIKNLLASLSSKNKLLPQEKLNEIIFLRLRQIEGYKNIISLKQKLVPDIRLIEGYVKKLQQERHRFLGLRKTIEIDINHQNNSLSKGNITNPVVEIYRRYDINTECYAIKEIEDMLKQLGIKIEDYKGADIKDFQLKDS
jgi:hypothetical protein